MIIVLVGLPGSGKTYLGKQLSKDLKIPYLEDILYEYLPNNFIIDRNNKTKNRKSKFKKITSKLKLCN